jgi:hypothetical protein
LNILFKIAAGAEKYFKAAVTRATSAPIPETMPAIAPPPKLSDSFDDEKAFSGVGTEVGTEATIRTKIT